MADLSQSLLTLRAVISVLGLLGNAYLIFSILQTKLSPIKSFELFLLGLAVANVEEIVIVNLYDMLILNPSLSIGGDWWCHLLKFLTVLGEIASILFTVLIVIFRYQKLRDAHKRVNLPIYLDSIRAAWLVSAMCVFISVLLSLPIFAMSLPGHEPGNSSGNSGENSGENSSGNGTRCLPDFFQCDGVHCPIFNRLYKFGFIVICHLLPLLIVTVSSCLIVAVLLRQRTAVSPVASVSGLGRAAARRSKGPKLQRSSVAVLAAMLLFQVDWTLYVVFQLEPPTSNIILWGEVEFLISTSYTSISPYVYGIGNNLFSCKNFLNK